MSKSSPPRATRFKKGQSGNPKGRPRKHAKVPEFAIDLVSNRKITIEHSGGGTKTVSWDEALEQKLFSRAMSGNKAARREVTKKLIAYEKAKQKRSSNALPTPKTVVHYDARNADEAMCILGISVNNPLFEENGSAQRGLLLATWATQEALRRRRSSKQMNQPLIGASTIDHGLLRWPRGTEQHERMDK